MCWPTSGAIPAGGARRAQSSARSSTEATAESTVEKRTAAPSLRARRGRARARSVVLRASSTTITTMRLEPSEAGSVYFATPASGSLKSAPTCFERRQNMWNDNGTSRQISNECVDRFVGLRSGLGCPEHSTAEHTYLGGRVGGLEVFACGCLANYHFSYLCEEGPPRLEGSARWWEQWRRQSARGFVGGDGYPLGPVHPRDAGRGRRAPAEPSGCGQGCSYCRARPRRLDDCVYCGAPEAKAPDQGRDGGSSSGSRRVRYNADDPSSWAPCPGCGARGFCGCPL